MPSCTWRSRSWRSPPPSSDDGSPPGWRPATSSRWPWMPTPGSTRCTRMVMPDGEQEQPRARRRRSDRSHPPPLDPPRQERQPPPPTGDQAEPAAGSVPERPRRRRRSDGAGHAGPPSMPDAPGAPDTPGTRGAPDPPGTRGAPDTPGTRGAPDAPDARGRRATAAGSLRRQGRGRLLIDVIGLTVLAVALVLLVSGWLGRAVVGGDEEDADVVSEVGAAQPTLALLTVDGARGEGEAVRLSVLAHDRAAAQGTVLLLPTTTI